MQKIASAILLLAFLGQTFNQGFYFIGYLVNKAEYERKCVNKARPQLHCNGQCQLMKKIRAQEQKEQQEAPGLKQTAKTDVLSSRSSFTMQLLNTSHFIKQDYTLVTIGKPVDRSFTYFHPPNA